MNNLLITALCLMFSIGTLSAQKGFEIIMPTTQVKNSAYSRVAYLDSRRNKKDFGFVQTTMVNKRTPVVERKALAEQFRAWFDETIDSTAQDRTLFIQLRDLKFREVNKANSEKGYCNIRISLYEKKDNQYYFINTIDTVVVVKAADVTDKLLKESSNTITMFIAKRLTTLPKDYDMPISIDDVRNVDVYEKKNIPLYSNNALVDGVYFNFQSFANQTPTIEKMQVKKKDDYLKEVKVVDPNNEKKWKKIQSADYYAVVVDGLPYIATEAGYFPIVKDRGDFVIPKVFLKKQSPGFMIGLGLGFGMVRGMMGVMMNSQSKELGPLMIDHLNGTLIDMY